MKIIYFRIIELKNYQVLLTKDFDEESEESTPQLTVSFFHEGLAVRLRFGFDNEEKRDDAFNTYNKIRAQKAVDTVLNMAS